MGLYLEHLKDGSSLAAHRDKAAALIADGAKELTGADIKLQPHLVCVVRNPTFDGAAYVYDHKEFRRFSLVDDRPTRWLVYTSPEIVRMEHSLIMDGVL